MCQVRQPKEFDRRSQMENKAGAACEVVVQRLEGQVYRWYALTSAWLEG